LNKDFELIVFDSIGSYMIGKDINPRKL